VYVNYDTGGIATKIKYSRREFGMFQIGDLAPDVEYLIQNVCVD
jgi:hypothetical protein